MKVIVNEKTDRRDDVKYPCLMINQDTQAVALFTKKNTGVMLKCSVSSLNTVGEYSTTWADCFTPFHGDITLDNDQ